MSHSPFAGAVLTDWPVWHRRASIVKHMDAQLKSIETEKANTLQYVMQPPTE